MARRQRIVDISLNHKSKNCVAQKPNTRDNNDDINKDTQMISALESKVNELSAKIQDYADKDFNDKLFQTCIAQDYVSI